MTETKIAIITVGHIDSGKSTLTGVLSTGELDNGNGSARSKVATHPHEIVSGRTSNIGSKTVNIDKKILSFYDLCGHDKYLKTTLYGISGYYPDYAIVTVAANNGVEMMTKKHFEVLSRFNLPVIIIITKPDIAPEEIYYKTLRNIAAFISKSTHSIRKPIGINNYYSTKDDKKDPVKTMLNAVTSHKVIPIVTVSNKTGYYLDVLRSFLKSLEPRDVWKNQHTPVYSPKFLRAVSKINTDPIPDHFILYIDRTFNVKNVGFVISGSARGSSVKVGDTIYLGPFTNGMVPVKIRSIHNNNYQTIETLGHHDRGCLCVAPVNKKEHRNMLQSRKLKWGTVATTNPALPACYRYKALVQIEDHSSTLVSGYTSVVYMGNIRQPCRLILHPDDNIKKIKPRSERSKVTLRTGDVKTVVFKFTNIPRFVERGMSLLFRCGKIHGYGIVSDYIPIADDVDNKPDTTDEEMRRVIRMKKYIESKSILRATE